MALVPLICGCESSQEKSAQIAKHAAKVKLATTGLVVTHANPDVHVLESVVLSDSTGTAVVVTLRNDSAHALANLPIAVTVRNAGGAVVYRNNAPGLQPSLTTLSLLPAHGQASWVDDQVTGSTGRTATALVGAAPTAPAPVPVIMTSGVSSTNDPTNGPTTNGTVLNGSVVAQSQLPVYAVARRAGRIVAAGRAVVATLAAHASGSFQIFLIGDLAGAAVQVSAPPSTLG
jgi:hypothetical protein